MKKGFLLLGVALLIVSCQVVENIDIKEDGSGSIRYDIDASQMMQMAGDQVEQSLKSEMGEVRDTVIDFSSLATMMKDSLAKMTVEEKQSFEVLKRLKLGMHMDPQKKELALKMDMAFGSVSELRDMMELLKKTQELKNGSTPTVGGGDYQELSYSYDGRKFGRKVTITNKDAFAKAKDSLGGVMALFGSSNYTLKYHFPKKVKSVSDKKAVISDDRRTVTMPYGLSEYMGNPEAMSLEIVLEK
ncbi:MULTISPECIES: hypothetical protein [unclassified Flavobacterium]|uniref:hypothetical protein n=1 Tax=unclassified Flavobacterium TaxID=196869 RepID=UPI001F12F183|nr:MULTISPECIES: hypothetical protein [unclassified Flavobacterium]UMY66952.1 hypothetical protein MKO97_06110 [Flavobacterium sp. HJ-32-4]